ncbi:MAG: TldD/PmbA family protein [Candidatus Kapabacteria bacterium]|nr:TldD/PmbA family protein [Candidatus Kapabacteria bacterium]
MVKIEEKYFFDKIRLSKEELTKLLSIALEKGGDFSEIFIEYRFNNSVTIEEDIVKSSSRNISIGAGIRVLNGEQTGYAFTNDLSYDKLKKVAITAGSIANSIKTNSAVNLNEQSSKNQFYSTHNLVTELDLNKKINLVRSAYDAALNYDKRIVKVSSTLADEVQFALICNSNGIFITDIRPQTRLMVVSTAEENKIRDTGFENAGGRVGVDFFETDKRPEEIGRLASEEAINLLSAGDSPAGEMTVVLGGGQSGVLIHEAVGHPLEADGAWKKTSIMSGKLGEMVANPLITIYDDATIPSYRGSLNVDDEGTETEPVLLIEKGKLVAYMNDLLSSRIMKHKPNGHGRRESYRFSPIPRMNNTVLEKGDNTAEEIIKSVKKGFYAKSFQGGMVNSTGKFTFSVNLGYLIENGQLAKPVKNATLIGSNFEILQNIDMIGNDTGFFLGTCGKDGQSVPVTCGTPTVRISKMTVGGKL